MRRQNIILGYIVVIALAVSCPSFAQTAGVPAAATQRVLITPFSPMDLLESQRWMPKSIQENMIANFSRAPGYAAVAYKGTAPVDDNAAAARLARGVSATQAIRGTVQVIDTQLKLRAFLIDAKSGNTLTTATAAGPSSDLLKLEDKLAEQLRAKPVGVAAVPASVFAPPTDPANQSGEYVPPEMPYVYQPPQVNRPTLGISPAVQVVLPPNYYYGPPAPVQMRPPALPGMVPTGGAPITTSPPPSPVKVHQ